jgi:hypothetical protein
MSILIIIGLVTLWFVLSRFSRIKVGDRYRASRGGQLLELEVEEIGKDVFYSVFTIDRNRTRFDKAACSESEFRNLLRTQNFRRL